MEEEDEHKERMKGRLTNRNEMKQKNESERVMEKNLAVYPLAF